MQIFLAAAVLSLAVLNGAQIIKVSWSSAQDPNTLQGTFRWKGQPLVGTGSRAMDADGSGWLGSGESG